MSAHRITQPPAGSAGAVVLDALTEWSRTLAGHVEVAATDPETAAHQTRVMSRRLRSALRSFERLFVDGSVTDLEERLKSLAGEFSPLRDAQVVRERLLSEAHDVDPDHEHPLLEAALDDLVAGAALRTRTAVQEWPALQADLEAFLADPPLRKRAARPLDDVAPKVVRAELDRVRRRAHRARRAPVGPEREERLHDLRKAGKRARYACDLLARQDRAYARPAEALTGLQTMLGDYNDCHTAEQVLLRLSQAVPQTVDLETEPGATDTTSHEADLYRRLAARERETLEGLVADLDDVLTEVEESMRRALHR